MITMLHVLETLEGYGGTPRKLLSLARRIDRRAATLVFAHFKHSPLAHEFVDCGWQVRRIGTESPLGLAWQIHQIAKECRADVICTHFTRSLVAGFVAAKTRRIPVIHNEHSSAYYRKGSGRMFARFILPWVDLVVCNSHHTCRSVRESFPGTNDKLVTIHNPVEERIARRSREEVRAAFCVADNEVLIAHIGGMFPMRDQITLLRAFNGLRKTSCMVRLLMIGEGPERAGLELKVKQFGLEKSVVFTGYSDEIGDYLKAADIYVNPTLDEGFGIAVVEAMLFGLPVVLSDCGAHPELVVSEKSGFLYEGGNATALASWLRYLIDKPVVRRLVGQAGKMQAQQRFSPDAFATQYLQAVKAISIISPAA